MNITCFSCGQQNHIVQYCPKLHYSRPKTLLLQQMDLSLKRLKNNARKNNSKKFNALSNNYEVQQAATDFRKILDYYNEEDKIVNIDRELVEIFDSKSTEMENLSDKMLSKENFFSNVKLIKKQKRQISKDSFFMSDDNTINNEMISSKCVIIL